MTNPTEGALTPLGFLCRLLRIRDVCKMRNVLRDVCLNHPTISC